MLMIHGCCDVSLHFEHPNDTMAQNDSTKLQENPNMHWQPQTRKHSRTKSSMLKFGMGESVNEGMKE